MIKGCLKYRQVDMKVGHLSANQWAVWLALCLGKFLIMQALVGTFNKGPSLGIDCDASRRLMNG